MILQSLYEYYEILVKAGEVPHPGYVIANVSYALNLSPQGELLNVIPLKQSVTRGKKTVEVPRPMEVSNRKIRRRALNLIFFVKIPVMF